MAEIATDVPKEKGSDTYQEDELMATRDKLIEEIENYIPLKDSLPSDVHFPCVNILLFGQAGSGKSATYNTLNSVFRGKIFNTALSGGSEHVLTRKFRIYPVMPRTTRTPKTSKCEIPNIENNHLTEGSVADEVQPTQQQVMSRINNLPLPLKFRICDMRGLEQDHLMTSENMRYILDGNISDRFPLDPSGNISSDMPGFKKHPGLDERIHCVAIVQDATIVDAIQDLSPEVTKNIKDMQTVMNTSDIPQVVILTKFDKICKATHYNTVNALRSKRLKTAVAQTAKIYGLPENSILPLKNYEKESDLEPVVDVFALRALKEMLNYCDAYLHHHIDEIKMRYTVKNDEIPEQ